MFIFSSDLNCVLCPFMCLIVKDDFEILRTMPVDEQKGDLNFYVFIFCVIIF